MNNIFEQGMFSIDQNATPEMLARKRATIQGLLRSNGTARYAGQGLAHLGQGIVSGVQRRNMDELEGVKTSEATDIFSRVLGRSGSSAGGNTPFLAPTAPAAPVEAVAAQSGTDTVQGGAGEDLLGAEFRRPNVAPAPQPESNDLRLLLARTMQAEAGNEGLQGMIDVGSVMRNREASGRFGEGLEGVIMRPGQFSAWNSTTGYAGGEQGQDMSFMPREDALRAADMVLSGDYEDQTGGATHYVNYNVSQPSWFNDSFQRRGNHWFGDGDGAGAVNGNTGALSGAGGQNVAFGQQGGDQLQQFGGNLNMPELMELAANPWLNAQQRDVVNGMIGNQRDTQRHERDNEQWMHRQNYAQQQQADDPLRQLQIQQAELNLAQDQAGVSSAATVQSSVPLDDGTTVMVMNDGTRRVLDPAGNLVEGTAAADAIRAAREYTVQNQTDISQGRREGTLGADIEFGGEAAAVEDIAEASVAAGINAWESYGKLQTSLTNIDEAINAIDGGAQSGLVYSMLPSVTLASASLENAMNRMGLDVVGAVTFGALSEGELRLAMATAVPQNLGHEELRSWLVRRRDAQQKAADMTADAAQFLTVPGNTINDWIERNRGGTSSSPPQSGAIDFSTMDAAGLGQVDIMSLTSEQMDAMERRFDELEGSQ